MSKQQIEKQWKRYEELCVPRDASTIQVMETKQAFYAGAQFLFSLLTNAVSPGDEVQLEDIVILEEVRLELEAYLEDRKKIAASLASEVCSEGSAS